MGAAKGEQDSNSALHLLGTLKTGSFESTKDSIPGTTSIPCIGRSSSGSDKAPQWSGLKRMDFQRKLQKKNIHFFKKKRFYLFIFGERRWEEERERNMNVWLPLIHPHLGTWTATQACCPRLGIKLVTWRPFGSQASTESTEPHQPGQHIHCCSRIHVTSHWRTPKILKGTLKIAGVCVSRRELKTVLHFYIGGGAQKQVRYKTMKVLCRGGKNRKQYSAKQPKGRSHWTFFFFFFF